MEPSELIKYLGGFSVVVAAIAWVARELIKLILSNLTEQFKADLAIQAKAYEIRYSKLHEAVADAIAKLYGLLSKAELRSAELAFLTMVESTESGGRLAVEAESLLDLLREISDFSKSHRIYFAENIASMLDRFTEGLEGPISNLYMAIELKKDNASIKEELRTFDKAWPQAIDIKTSLETEFRKLLGVGRYQNTESSLNNA